MKNHTPFNYKLSLKLLLGLVLFAYSCKKDPPIPNPNNLDCIDIPPFQLTGYGYNYITNGLPFYRMPELNPNNPNELLILKDDSVFIFNRILSSKMFAFKYSFWSKVLWSKQNWLLFGASDQKIYKIRPDGSNLTLLINTPGNYWPIWNDDGTLFCVQNTIINKGIIFTDTGIPVDTIIWGTELGSDWGANNNIAGGGNELNMINVTSNTTTSLYNTGSSSMSISGCVWINNNEVIWSYGYGILKTNISTHTTVFLKHSCNSNRYFYPTYDNVNNKIIWQKQEQTLIDSSTVKTINKIVITDLDATNEIELKIN